MVDPMVYQLAELEPVLLRRIKELAALTIRTFDGAPDHVREFMEAQRLLAAIEQAEVSEDREPDPLLEETLTALQAKLSGAGNGA